MSADPALAARATPDMPTSPRALLDRLAALGIAARTYEHEPFWTVDQSRALRGEIPGGHCKTLFLKDKKGQLWMVVALESTEIDLKALAPRIGAGRLSFGRPELLWQVLGVRPGAVTPFALVNDTGHEVRVVLDAKMMALDLVNYHPLVNSMTTCLATADLARFVASCGHKAQIVALAPDGAARARGPARE